MKKQVSIIVPIYNLEEYIENCIMSILCQTYKDIEVLLIDDASTDNSENICRKYEERDERIKYIKQTHKGVSAARNKGIEESTGEYIMFVDGDDYVSPDIVKTLLNGFLDETIIMTACNRKIVYNKEEAFQLLQIAPKVVSCYDYLKDCFLGRGYASGVCAKMYKRENIGDIRFQNGKIYGEDSYFCYQYCIKEQKNIYYIPEKMYAYLMKSDSVCHTMFTTEKLSRVEFATLIYEQNKANENMKEYALYNYINSRLVAIKGFIRSNKYKEAKMYIQQFRKDILQYTMPKIRGGRQVKRLEYIALKLGIFIYYLFVKIYDKIKEPEIEE